MRERNAIDAQIAEIIGRPAHTGHIGEYIASQVFGIRLHDSASHKGNDGYFAEGSLMGQTVNIKFYSSEYQRLPISSDNSPDYYLVLTGPRNTGSSSGGATIPCVVSSIFLFRHSELVQRQNLRGLGVGAEVNVWRGDWDEAEIYPSQSNSALHLSQSQIDLISRFGVSGTV